jgi:hypothetical protein
LRPLVTLRAKPPAQRQLFRVELRNYASDFLFILGQNAASVY